MPNVIQLLPEHIASKIAAGEVIQRPASVFKELVENAIDAQASKIAIIVKAGGKEYLQVTDDGVGMTPEDARLCFEKHATSKIKNINDLFHILTKGFRGEALSSIAAVARVELKTKTADAELGTRLVIEDNKVLINEPCACPTGTTIDVQNLFFNLPARKSFLKDDHTEFRYINDEFERLAIPHFNIHFTLTHNEKLLYQLPAVNNLFSRIEYFLDNTSKSKFISIQESTPAFDLKAYLGSPEIAKKKRDVQMIFINQRYIKNNYLTHAVYEAYKGLIPPDHHPSFLLFFSIHPSRIDWNVHPAKIEARLLDEKLIYPFLISVIKKGLGVSGITQTFEFSKPPDIDLRDIDIKKTAPPPRIHIDPNYSPFNTSDKKIPSPVWEEYYKIFQEKCLTTSAQQEDQGNLNLPNTSVYPLECFQWLNKYIICSVHEKLLIIDQHRAHERIHYEQLKSLSHTTISQTLLFPVHIELSPKDFLLLKELIPTFKENGFDIEEFGTRSIVVHAYPNYIDTDDIPLVIESTLENFRLNQIAELQDSKENFYRALAKSMSVKYGQILTKPEMLKLLDELFSCKEYTYSPSGKRILKEMDREEINAFFKK